MKQRENNPLDEFLECRNCSENNLRLFCKLVYEKELEGMLWPDRMEPPKLRIINLPIKSNGSVWYSYFSKYRHAVVVVNLFPLLHSQICNSQMTYVYLYVTVVHELEHINLLRRTEQNAEPDYHAFLAAWEQWYRHRGMGAYAVPDMLFSRRKRNADKEGATSITEIYCNIRGFMRAYTMLKDCLWPHNRQLIIEMIEDLEFIIWNQEIAYDMNGQPVGLFVHTMKQMRLCMRYLKHPLEHIPMLKYIFNTDSTMISVDEMMMETEMEYKLFYDAILIRMFIYDDIDWSKRFDRVKGLRDRINELANDYCQQCVNYLKNRGKAIVYLPENALQDNVAMLIKTCYIVKKKMKQYDMESTTGGVIPMYCVH